MNYLKISVLNLKILFPNKNLDLVLFQKSHFVLKNLKVLKLKSCFMKKCLSYLFRNLKAISLKSNVHETRKWELRKSIDFSTHVESNAMKMIVFV